MNFEDQAKIMKEKYSKFVPYTQKLIQEEEGKRKLVQDLLQYRKGRFKTFVVNTFIKFIIKA